MGNIVIGLGEFAITKRPGDSVRTLGLGSCVALMALHPVSGAVGMAHIVLPESRMNLTKAGEMPCYFADTAVPAMFDALCRLTGSYNRYIVKLAGGAAVLKLNVDASDLLNIGKRNVLATKKALWKRGLGPIAEDTGGDGSRSVSITVGSAQVEVRLGNVLLRTI